MLHSLLLISELWLATSIEFNRNIVYDGPFNQHINLNQQPQRRLSVMNQDHGDAMFYHGVASGEPTSSDLIVCTT